MQTIPRLTLILLALAVGAPLPATAAGPGVIVAATRLAPLEDRTEALGTLRANESVVITAKVTESISALHFDDGHRVAAGDLLVEMTSREEHALVEEASARVAEARRQYDRIAPLAASGSASASQLDERRRDLDTARAALLALEARLADRLIKAPFAGVVGLRDVSLGTLVTPGQRITTLDDVSVMKLDFPVPSILLPSLVPGLGIEAHTRAFPRRSFEGTVSAVDSRVDPITRAVQVRALLPNSDGLLRPGMLMRVDLLRNPREGLVIPESALLHRGEAHYVLRVETAADGSDPRAERRQVQIGTRRPGLVEITAGLVLGDRVITHGADKARPGEPVTVLAEEDGQRSLAELLGTAP
ncbi:MAG: efflux RND transporter periplasmic adaptor subunit [Chromatiaceae bacterium]|nr:MAG: efflux RND transporter periplasmic adaptor subunit [Chromatiaceae bacterium]